ncbi:hypothetical protein FRC12_022406 [Ceratobasidium sp. 428]|nr:hypothetical protein FRC12_022406 [Ceratobasidium sp. 428]
MPAQRVSKASKRARKARQSVNGYIKHGFCDCDMCYGTVAVTYPKSLIKDHRQIYGHSRAMSYYAEPSAPPEHTLASPPIPVPDQMVTTEMMLIQQGICYEIFDELELAP